MDVAQSSSIYQQVDVADVIYRANDIRGVVGQELSENVYYTLGLAFGTQMRAQHINRVVVGRDGRISGPTLANALMEGLMSTGVEVIDIGLVPSPVLYYATHIFQTGTGMMVTGSHNPPQYNGLKMMLGGKTVNQDGILALRDIVKKKQFASDVGHRLQTDILDDYVADVVSKVKISKPLKIVIDCGHGAAGIVAEKLYQSLGLEVITLFGRVDGHFPAHHPDPSVDANLQDLIHAVKTHGADCGLAFDGDGDRLGCVTSTGEIIRADRQLMLYAQHALALHPKSPIIFDVKCSAHLSEWIVKHGGQPIMYKTGHAFIKSKMLEMKAPLAGEMSGHFFFGDPWYGFDDALYTGAKLLEILASSSKNPAAIFAALPDSVNTPEIQVKISDERKFKFIDALKKAQVFGDADIVTIDGLRVEYPDGWGLVRASNTSPCLVLRFEAKTQSRLKQLQDQFKTALLGVDPTLEILF